MRILGIDPGTAIVGYSIVDFKEGRKVFCAGLRLYLY